MLPTDLGESGKEELCQRSCSGGSLWLHVFQERRVVVLLQIVIRITFNGNLLMKLGSVEEQPKREQLAEPSCSHLK